MSDEDNDTPAAPAKAAARTVPYERFQSVVAARRELEGKIEALTVDLQAAAEKAATADTLAEQLRAAKADHEASAAAWARDRGLIGLGLIDDEARAVAVVLHERLPEADRPALLEWVGALREAPDDIPAALRPYLGSKVAPPEQLPPTAAKLPDPGRRQPLTPPVAATATAEAIRAAKNHGAQTGDWARFNELREQFAAERQRR